MLEDEIVGLGHYFFFPKGLRPLNRPPPRPGNLPPPSPGNFGASPVPLGGFCGACPALALRRRAGMLLSHLLLQGGNLFRRWLRHAAAGKAEHRGHFPHRAAALGTAHRLHHVGHLPVLFQELVDILDLDAGPRRDTLLREAFRISGLRRSSRVIEEIIARWRLMMRSSMLAEAS